MDGPNKNSLSVDETKRYYSSALTHQHLSDALRGVGPSASWDEDLRKGYINKLANNWFKEFGRSVFPQMDEFEVSTDLVLLTPDHAQHEQHTRITLNHLGAWAGAEQRRLRISG